MKAKIRKQAREYYDYDKITADFPGFKVIENNDGELVQAEAIGNLLTDLPEGNLSPFVPGGFMSKASEKDMLFLNEIGKQLNKRNLSLFLGSDIGDDFSDLYAGRLL